MTANRFVTSIFCDDIRKEEGNKFSYMGIYNSVLQAQTFPLTLPKLCVATSFHCRGGGPLPNSLTFSLFMGDLLLGQIPFDIMRITSGASVSSLTEEQTFIATAVMQVFPLVIAGACLLKVRASCDGEELRGGALSVEAAPT